MANSRECFRTGSRSNSRRVSEKVSVRVPGKIPGKDLVRILGRVVVWCGYELVSEVMHL